MIKNFVTISFFNTLLLLIVMILIGIGMIYLKKLNKQLSISNELNNLKHGLVVETNTNSKICSNDIRNREEFFALLPDINTINSLEIAPWFTPILKGKNVKYFDVLDKENLIKKALVEKLDINKIPEIHYVHPEGDMSLIKEKFGVIFSSHNIEHQVDLIKHLVQLSNLLDNNGKIFMAIPDKRYCFDHYVSETPISVVLATHWQGDKTHSLQTILAMRCETTHNDSKNHWQGDHGNNTYQNSKNCYFDALKEYQEAKGLYIDAHKWRFTPESFYNIIEELYNMKLQPLRIEKVSCTSENSHEFYVILYKP